MTLGHILLAAAALEALTGALLLARGSKARAGGAGTPAYARARDARRMGFMLLASALVFVILALLTPIGDLATG